MEQDTPLVTKFFCFFLFTKRRILSCFNRLISHQGGRLAQKLGIKAFFSDIIWASTFPKTNSAATRR